MTSGKPHVLAVGGNEVVLEGVVQTLAANGFRVSQVSEVGDAEAVAREDAPLVILVDSTAGYDVSALVALPRMTKGAVVLWRSASDAAPALSAPLSRAILAELELPLERSRLLVLCGYVLGRHLEAGRDENGDVRESEARSK